MSGEISVEVAPVEGDDPPADVFRFLVLRDGRVAETYASVTTKRSKDNVATRVNATSELIEVRESGRGPAPAPPGPQTVVLAPAAPRTGRRRSAGPPRCTSGTPTAVRGSAGWKRWTRSPWSPSRT